MSRSWSCVVMAGLFASGCYIEANENGKGPPDEEQPATPSGCDAPKPASDTDAGPNADATASCKAHADCGAGFFCLIGSGTCTEAKLCEQESDCLAGFNCDAPTKSCLPSASETCGELGNEAACVVRKDCEPTYAGVDCGCGADCTCKGGEPGCVCSGFEFFRCEPVSQ